jgi:hypothetical protein
MDQQGSDASRQHARQQAQDFMGQFRDERQGFRQDMFDNFGYKSYGPAAQRASLEPAKIYPQSRDSERRLNLVA